MSTAHKKVWEGRSAEDPERKQVCENMSTTKKKLSDKLVMEKIMFLEDSVVELEFDSLIAEYDSRHLSRSVCEA